MRQLLLFSLLNFCWLCLHAQERDSVAIGFHFRFGKETLQVGPIYVSDQKDTLSISTFKCYVSGIRLFYADGTYITNNDHHLLDVENEETLQFKVGGNPAKSISKIVFNVGVDSLASVSGALSGDLDPTKGMYWAWQSGFINMKIEGKSHSCKTRNNEFQFHIGGYLEPHYALREIVLENPGNSRSIIVDLATLFTKIELSTTNSIMIPGKKAMEIADYSQRMFRIE